MSCLLFLLYLSRSGILECLRDWSSPRVVWSYWQLALFQWRLPWIWVNQDYRLPLGRLCGWIGEWRAALLLVHGLGLQYVALARPASVKAVAAVVLIEYTSRQRYGFLRAVHNFKWWTLLLRAHVGFFFPLTVNEPIVDLAHCYHVLMRLALEILDCVLAYEEVILHKFSSVD